VTPLTLGIETAGGVSTPMIERNTTIPSKKSQTFSTYADNQTAVDVKVLQGERPMAEDNKMLGNFRLEGIPSAPRGVPQIEVTFDIDANGILHVTAKDQGTGKDQKITISGSSGLDQDEVERLKKEAEAHAEEDRKRKEAVEARNELDNLCYQAEKQKEELADKLSEDQKSALDVAIGEGRKVLGNEAASAEELSSARDKITGVLNQVAQSVYAQAGAEAAGSADAAAGAQPEGSSSAEGSNDDVVDADFEVVDDEDKQK